MNVRWWCLEEMWYVEGNRRWEFVSTTAQVSAHGCQKSTLCFCGGTMLLH